MTEFKHVLVPYDGSDSSNVALDTAIHLQKTLKSRITAVYVKKTESDMRYKEVGESLNVLASENGVDIAYLHPTGRMYKEVVSAVSDVDADIIIMGTHGVSGFEEFWIGSNAFRVVSSANVPVITMQETVKQIGFNKIIAPVDQSKETRQKIPVLEQLAKLFGAEIHLLGATKYSDEESQKTVRRYVEQSKELLEQEELSVTESYVLGQNIAKATLDCAQEIQADLVIMMSESEPSSGLFMGSNAQQVVNRSSIPVLTIHPKDVSITVAGY